MMFSPSSEHQRRQDQTQYLCNQPDYFLHSQQSKTVPQHRPNVSNLLLTKLEQAGKVPSKEKFRRMCCQTFLSTGGCPYNDRCVFLHDPRLQIDSFRLRTVKNVRQSGALKDSFYWPDMERSDVSVLLDVQGLPDAKQEYTIPTFFSQVPYANHHDRALYSIWAHFIDVCIDCNSSRADPSKVPSLGLGARSRCQANRSVESRHLNHVAPLKHLVYQSPITTMKCARNVGLNRLSPHSVASTFPSPRTELHPFSTFGIGPDVGGKERVYEQDHLIYFDRERSSHECTRLGPQEEVGEENHRNKYLHGVWRLPIFILLSEAERNRQALKNPSKKTNGDSACTTGCPEGCVWTSAVQRPSKPYSSIGYPCPLPPPMLTPMENFGSPHHVSQVSRLIYSDTISNSSALIGTMERIGDADLSHQRYQEHLCPPHLYSMGQYERRPLPNYCDASVSHFRGGTCLSRPMQGSTDHIGSSIPAYNLILEIVVPVEEVTCGPIGICPEVAWQHQKNGPCCHDLIFDPPLSIDSTCLQTLHSRSEEAGFLFYQPSLVEHFPLNVGQRSLDYSLQHGVEAPFTRKYRYSDDLTDSSRSVHRLQHNPSLSISE